MQRSIQCGHVAPKSLILAVAAHVEENGPKPPELDWWTLREWGTPHSGGWLEWPARDYARARAARNVYVAFQGWHDTKNAAQWCNDNPAAWELVSSVMAMKEGADNDNGR